MNSQFDQKLPLRDDCRRITAQGPLTWNSHDAPHCRITVVLTQNGHSGHGDTGNYNHGDPTWECDVERDDGGCWDPNLPVHCMGTILMSSVPPNPDQWPPQDVVLDHETAAAPA
jgi:hypothetical protein